MVIGPAGQLAECRAKACSVIEMRWNSLSMIAIVAIVVIIIIINIFDPR